MTHTVSQRLASTTEPWVRIDLMKKTVRDSSHLATLNRFFACRIVVLGLLKLNFKARHDIPEFKIAHLLLIHVIALDNGHSYIGDEMFSLHPIAQFLLNGHQAAHWQKSENENLKFGTEVAVPINSNLSRCLLLRQVVNLDLLLWTELDSEHAVLFLCHIFTQRLLNDQKIERRDEYCFWLETADSLPQKISFHMNKKGV